MGNESNIEHPNPLLVEFDVVEISGGGIFVKGLLRVRRASEVEAPVGLRCSYIRVQLVASEGQLGVQDSLQSGQGVVV